MGVLEEINNVYYQGIPGLLIPKNVAFNKIDEEINNFINLVPELIDRIEYNHENNRKEYLTKNLEQLLPLLEEVYAKWLLTDGQIILRGVINEDDFTSTVSIDQFISDIKTLSIEMQKARRMNKDEPCAVSAKEKHTAVANNLLAIGKLIDDGEHERAESIIKALIERDIDNSLKVLLRLHKAGSFDEVKTLTETLIDKHKEAIKHLEIDMSKKVLAVDDRPEILTFVNSALSKYYKVFGVGNGITALKVMAVQKPNLFILDIDMPDMDGFELAEKIRMQPEYTSTPIIFLTGNSTQEHITRAMEVGGNDFLVKPSNTEALLTKASKYLAKEEFFLIL